MYFFEQKIVKKVKGLVHAFFLPKNCKKSKGVSQCFFEQKIVKKLKGLVLAFFITKNYEKGKGVIP